MEVTHVYRCVYWVESQRLSKAHGLGKRVGAGGLEHRPWCEYPSGVGTPCHLSSSGPLSFHALFWGPRGQGLLLPRG